MNAIPNSVAGLDKNNTEVVHEIEDGIFEVGAVTSETKGFFFGSSPDNGGGWTFG